MNGPNEKPRCFEPELFDFLDELKENNRREWFQANRRRYESKVKEPMLRFIAEFGERLDAISAYFVADPRPVGGSMFRIHRDVRFSRDKSPFKTNVAAHFSHRAAGKGVHAPGFYLHLERGACVGGGGLYHPDAPTLQKVRERIVSRPEEWRAVLDRGIEIGGDTLRRPPRGYDASHPFIEDLKRRDFYTLVSFSERDVCAPDFLDRYVEACRGAAPLVAFLTRALGLPW